MEKLIFIAFGGMLGALMRYSANEFIYTYYKGVFPAGTLFVNSLGSFIIGILYALSFKLSMNPSVRLMLFVGFLGSFTTFSTYSLETLNLIRSGELKTAFLNIILNNTLSLLLAFAGFYIIRSLLKLDIN